MKRLLAFTAFGLLLPLPAHAAPTWDVLFPEFVSLPIGTTVEIDAWLRPNSYEPVVFDDVDWGYTVTTTSPDLAIQYPNASDVHDHPRINVVSGVPLSPSLDGLTLVIPEGETWPAGIILFSVAYFTLNTHGTANFTFQFHIGSDYVTFNTHVSEGAASVHGGTTKIGAPLGEAPVPEPTSLALFSVALLMLLVKRPLKNRLMSVSSHARGPLPVSRTRRRDRLPRA